MKAADSLEQRLRQLREDFDSSFARPWEPKAAEPNALLCFTASGHRFAAALTELQAISKAGPVVPVPSGAPALLGLTVLRAKLMPVYSLPMLLGLAAGAPAEICWLAVLRGRRPAALALDTLAGFADPQPAGDASPEGIYPFAKGPVRHGDHLHVLLDCSGLYDAITHDPSPSMKAQEPTP
ncbi:MAG TPA: chemotaxis protein CheW [Acidobacteriaceae bacterium]|jgi:chemotaxis signal transduction protein|nr:chemotaxis protein CheW [Acidobacteriaceae bacterium]